MQGLELSVITHSVSLSSHIWTTFSLLFFFFSFFFLIISDLARFHIKGIMHISIDLTCRIHRFTAI